MLKRYTTTNAIQKMKAKQEQTIIGYSAISETV